MRFAGLICLSAAMLLGQGNRQPGTTLVIGPQNRPERHQGAHGPEMRPGSGPVRNRGSLGRMPLGYWGIGYGGFNGTVGAPPPQPQAAPPVPPILASSSLYEPDRAQPVMREYSDLPLSAPSAFLIPARPVALIAFRDGRVEPVQAYWLEGDELAFLGVNDLVRRAPKSTVDVGRSESLSLQQGVRFSLPKAR